MNQTLNKFVDFIYCLIRCDKTSLKKLNSLLYLSGFTDKQYR